MTWKVLARAERAGTIVKLRHGVYIHAEALAALLGSSEAAARWQWLRPRGRARPHADQQPSLKDLGDDLLVNAHLLAALAEQVARPDLVASHETAALAHRIPLRSERGVAAGEAQMTIPQRTGRGRHSGGTLVERVLPGVDVTAAPPPFDALWVTSPERTAVDIATRGDLVASLMAADHVARLGVDPRRLRGDVSDVALAATCHSLGAAADRAELRAGRPAVLRMLQHVDPRREAASESASFAVMVEAGLPLPLPQQRFDTQMGTVFTDFWWRLFGLAGECDGLLKYLGLPDAASQAAADRRRVQEKLRQEALAEIGVPVVRWWAGDALLRPDRLVDMLTDALRRRGWDGATRR